MLIALIESSAAFWAPYVETFVGICGPGCISQTNRAFDVSCIWQKAEPPLQHRKDDYESAT